MPQHGLGKATEIIGDAEALLREVEAGESCKGWRLKARAAKAALHGLKDVGLDQPVTPHTIPNWRWRWAHRCRPQ